MLPKRGSFPFSADTMLPRSKTFREKVAKPVQTKSLNFQVIQLQKCHGIEFFFLGILGIGEYDTSYDIEREDAIVNGPVTCFSSAVTVMGPGEQ